MGSVVSQAMDENMGRMQEMQEKMMERQIQMQNFMRERQMAMQLAKNRELFQWVATFYGIATTGIIIGYMKTKKPGIIIPFIPLSFIVAYQYDLAFGSKMKRIREEADKILEKEKSSLYLPGSGLPTIQNLDDLRSKGYKSSNK